MRRPAAGPEREPADMKKRVLSILTALSLACFTLPWGEAAADVATPSPAPVATPAPSADDAQEAAKAALTAEQRGAVASALTALSGVKSALDAPVVGFREPETGILLTVSASGAPSLYCVQDHTGVTCTCGLTSTAQTLSIGGETFEIWLNKSAAVPKKHVKPDSINVRSGPGTDYEKTYTLLQDRVAYVYATFEGWSLVVYGESNVGFVSSGLLTVKPSASKSPKPVKDDDEDDDGPGPGGRPGGRR